MQRFPTLEDCDQDDPRDAHRWVAAGGIPFHGSTPLLLQPDVLPDFSEQLSDCGLVHAPSLARFADENGYIHVSQLPKQKKRPTPAFRGQQHMLNPASALVDVDADDPYAVIPDPAQFTRHEQEVLKERLKLTGVITEPEPEIKGAKIMPDFNPSDHTPSVVHGYLLAADDDERRRVLALEMRGKQRDKILNRPEWRGL